MVDNAFEPGSLHLDAGEDIRLVFHNSGRVTHEVVVGDEEFQREHELLRSSGDMHHGSEHSGHGDATAITVQPGDTGELVITSEDRGSLLVGCHEPGHYDDGMRMTVNID